MTTLRTITGFRAALAGGGVRPNLFEVSIPAFPLAAFGNATWTNDARNEFRFLCKAAALPASNIAPIDVPFRGRILKVAGDRTFDTWTVTIINDENFRLRSAFETWMNGMSKLNNATGATNPNSYMTDAWVYQLGRGAGGAEVAAGSPAGINQTRNLLPTPNDEAGGNNTVIPALRSYRFYGIFPTNISQIDLSYDSSDTIEEYTVEFQVQWWSAGDTGPGGPGLLGTDPTVI